MHTKNIIIQERKDSKEGKDVVADMGLLGAEVGARENVAKLR